MNIAFITNLRAPYRTLQFNEFAKIPNTNITVYYTNKPKDNRKWNTNKAVGFKEVDLKGVKISNKYGYLNLGISKIIKNNDLILIGGYEQPTIILLVTICKILKKDYMLTFDGISRNKVYENNNGIKEYIKKYVINGSKAIIANGEIGKLYFKERYNYESSKIYNQYLSVDNDAIQKIKTKNKIFNYELRKKLGINKDEFVLLYSGRVIDIKNLKIVIKASKNIDIRILIVGGGEQEAELIKLAKQMKVNLKITGFIEKQEELFKYYSVADAFILPSIIEPWGLVINEFLNFNKPIILSNQAGSSLDLVKNGVNGFIIEPNNINSISESIFKCRNMKFDGLEEYNSKLLEIWNFKNSRKSFEKIINESRGRYEGSILD